MSTKTNSAAVTPTVGAENNTPGVVLDPVREENAHAGDWFAASVWIVGFAILALMLLYDLIAALFR